MSESELEKAAAAEAYARHLKLAEERVRKAEEADRYAPPRPGGALVSEEDETAAEELPDPGSRIGAAHYTGLSDEESVATWKRETLCVSCMSVGVCRVADGVESPLVVVSRCLAYLPTGG